MISGITGPQIAIITGLVFPFAWSQGTQPDGRQQPVLRDTKDRLPPRLIENGMVKGDEISFSVTRTFGDNKIVMKYSGKVEGDTIRGPLGATPLDASNWKNAPGLPISGGGTWTSYTLDTKTGQLYVPGGNPAPDFVIGAREGDNSFTDSVVVLDAKTGNYKNHFEIVKKDWHDWDVSNPPVLIQTMGGKQLMAVAPKDGYLYGFDLATKALLYRVPVTRVQDVKVPFTPGTDIHFCPGSVGGAEWNSPSHDPRTNLIMVGEVEWCDTVTLQSVDKLKSIEVGQPWVGMATLNPFNMFGKEDRTWAGWLHAADADTGVWKWRVKTNYPIIGAVTPTAGGVVFFGDIGGNFYALDSTNGEEL